MDTKEQNEKLNHCRIHQFLNKATEKLHQIFRRRWSIYKSLEKQDEESEWKNTQKYGGLLLSLCSDIPLRMAEIMKNGNIDLWDVTATNMAIQAVTKEIQNHGENTDKKEDKIIFELKEIRNIIAHGQSKLSDNDYANYCDQLTKIMIKAGDKKSDIEAYKKELMKFGQPKVVEKIVEKVVEKTNETIVEKIVEIFHDEKPRFLKLKEEANNLLKERKFDEAIEEYNKALEIPGLSPEDQALIYSNRSAAYLMVKTPNSLLMAKRDAEWAIQLWPCWWRGYFRLGRVQCELNDLDAAEESFLTALAIKPGSNDIEHELSVVRAEKGILSRQDNYNPALQPKTIEEQVREMSMRWGISENDAKDLREVALNTPEAIVSKGHQYREGNGVQQDYAMAAKFYTKAANDGIAEGMYNLAKLHYDGKGVKRDFVLAINLLKRAVKAKPPLILMGSGIPEAKHMLGLMYAEGTGVTQDYNKAVEWYEKAIMNGYGESANNLGQLYLRGKGVEKSQTKAFYYFKTAAELGDTVGMYNVAHCYFYCIGTESLEPTKADITEGMRWLRIAKENGNIVAADELEKQEKLNPQDRYQVGSVKKLIFDGMAEKVASLDQDKYGKSIREAAKKGSKTAQQIIEIWDSMNAAMEAFKKNEADEVCVSLAKAIRLDYEIAEIPLLLKQVVEKRIQSHPDDLNVIVCNIWLNVIKTNSKIVVHDYYTKYPKDEYLLELVVLDFMDQKQFTAAVDFSKVGLNFNQNSLRFKYLLAISLALHDSSSGESVKAFDVFIAAAPIDHQKIPECHYRKAKLYLTKKDYPKFLKIFEAGIESEKKQLPCFLPYNFQDKEILEKMYKIFKSKKENGDHPSSSLPSSSAVANPNTTSQANMQRIILNPKRKILLCNHREKFAQIEYLSHKKGLKKLAATVAKPPNTPKRPSLANLKKITLKEMDPTTDKCYDGYVLEAKIIDWAVIFHSVITIIEDENGDLERLSVHNWPEIEDVEKIMKTFRPNCMISIINPYMRQSRNHETAIRVEDQAYINFDNTSSDSQCHTCGKEAKLIRCFECSLSKYCSKECQKIDLNMFNHKDVCKYLQKYSNLTYNSLLNS